MAANLERRAQGEKGTDDAAALPRPADRSVLPEGLREPIRSAVHTIEPGAEIILYGSRARGDTGPDSDWDLLILVDGLVDSARKSAIRHRLYEVEWTLGEVLTSTIYSRQDWNSPLYRAMPFHQNVDRDGLLL